MAERDLNSEFTGNVSIFSQTKPRQAVKVDPTDDAHMTTHQPPDLSQGNYGDKYDIMDNNRVKLNRPMPDGN